VAHSICDELFGLVLKSIPVTPVLSLIVSIVKEEEGATYRRGGLNEFCL